ncbi:MAG: YbjN domain-containing protein [Cyanobacteria bacterium P01_A01_bin.37]
MVPSADAFNRPDVSANIVDVIETVISSLEDGGGAMVNHTNEGYLWKFKYGSVEVFVQLTGVTDEDTLVVWSNVLMLPVRDEPKLMRKLLEMNWADTFEARFCIFGNEVVISTTRVVAELSAGEISRKITVVATIADEQDDLLAAEFGCG